jgi:hypothetical protein
MKTNSNISKFIKGIGLGTILLFSTQKLNAQKPLVVVAGFELVGLTSEVSTLRTVAIKEINNSQKYLATDQYDIAETMVVSDLNACLGTICLTKIGTTLKSDYAIGITFHVVGNRIISSVKMVNVKTATIEKSMSGDFENQKLELARITEIMIRKILDLPENEGDIAQLMYKSPMITSEAAQRIKNNGPRIGMAIATGQNADYLTRKEVDGGKASIPLLFNIGYQLEAQYAGTKQFSFLSEFIFNASGLEQGLIIPSFAVLTGCRFGKKNWEVAIGPSFSAKQLIKGALVDGKFRTLRQINELGLKQTDFEIFQRPDARGATYFSSNLVIGVGRTFRSGSLNIPLNFYGSLNKYGTSFGISVGFNLNHSKEYIERKNK